MKNFYVLLWSVLFFSCDSDGTSYAETSNEEPSYVESNSFDFESGEVGAADCSDAKYAASEGYDYARKAYNSETLEDIQYYAKKAMNEFESATSYASDCGCDDANSAADEAYTFARKAYYADSFEDGESYAKKAMNAGEEVDYYASDCENQ